MLKKKILTIGPVSPQPEDLSSIANTLAFLDKDYDIDYLDSLSIMQDLPNQEYYSLWEQKLAPLIHKHDIFFGFSFGGVILQQCFSLFASAHKPIVLFSTPTFSNESLTKKLGNVITLCQEDKLEEALIALYEPVFYPNKIPAQVLSFSNKFSAINRLIWGLNRVLNTDSTHILRENNIPHLHLIGACSNLVNSSNVMVSKTGCLLSVPQAGMRVLQDNPLFCKQAIIEYLNMTGISCNIPIRSIGPLSVI